MSINTALNFSCTRGGEWYACNTSSQFVGCCSVNPCTESCPKHALHPITFDPATFGKFPDLTCGTGAFTFTCSTNQTFYGCCKTNPCFKSECPIGDLVPAFAGSSILKSIYGDPSLNFVGAAPLTTASPKQAPGPLSRSPQSSAATKIGGLGAIRLMGISIAILVTVCLGLGLWLIYRNLTVRSNGRTESAERDYIPAATEELKNKDTQVNYDESDSYFVVHDIRRLGSKTIFILLATTLVVAGVCGTLAFLWFADSQNASWHSIMVSGWATRSVALSALLLRTAVDLQAAIASAILASLLMESKHGLDLYQLANVSPMRAATSSLWTLGSSLLGRFTQCSSSHRQNIHIYAMMLSLLVTTSILQFSSTLLLSDLKIGPLVGHHFTSEVRTSISYSGEVEKIPRDSSWTTNPPLFPTFGEYSEAPSGVEDGIADTGVLLRAFPPFSTAEDRQRLASYEGNALVLDARVSCQAPVLTQFNASAPTSLNRQLIGVVAPSKKSGLLRGIAATPFDCAVAWEGQISICQIGLPAGSFTGSLTSHFTESKTYGATFLVIDAAANHGSEWLQVTTDSGGVIDTSTAQISMSMCFAPWDAAILKVRFLGETNRTEPVLPYWKRFQSSEVLEYLIPGSNKSSRPIMSMDKPQNLLGDRPPPQRRPIVQSDIGGSSAAVRGTIAPLPGNWTAFVGGVPLVTVVDSFETAPSQVISADPALAAIFTDALDISNSVSWALSSLLTVLSTTNYYGQQAAFDRLDDVVVSSFQDVLYPRDYVGFTVVMWVLVAHFLLVGLLIVLFVLYTRHTLLGNAWSAFAQLAESPHLRKHIVDISTKTDSETYQHLKDTQSTTLRAKIVGRGAEAEVVVE